MHDSSGEPAGPPECPCSFLTDSSGSDFDVGGATTEDQVRGRAARKGDLMDNLESRLSSYIV